MPGHLNLGVTLMKLGQPGAAAREFEQALLLQPGDPRIEDYLRQARSRQ